MKLLILLLFSVGLFAQDGIYLNDGSSIKISADAKVWTSSKKLFYREPGKKKRKVKFADLEYAAWNGKLFRTVLKDGKPKGYFVVADQHGHSLAVFVRNRTKYTGGFQSPYKSYDVAELRSGKIVQDITFTNSNHDQNPEKRSEAYEMISRNFSQCDNLSARLKASGEPDRAVLALFEDVAFVPCD